MGFARVSSSFYAVNSNFVTQSLVHTSLIFVGKACPYSELKKGGNLTHKYLTWVEVVGRYKPARLLKHTAENLIYSKINRSI